MVTFNENTICLHPFQIIREKFAIILVYAAPHFCQHILVRTPYAWLVPLLQGWVPVQSLDRHPRLATEPAFPSWEVPQATRDVVEHGVLCGFHTIKCSLCTELFLEVYVLSQRPRPSRFPTLGIAI